MTQEYETGCVPETSFYDAIHDDARTNPRRNCSSFSLSLPTRLFPPLQEVYVFKLPGVCEPLRRLLCRCFRDAVRNKRMLCLHVESLHIYVSWNLMFFSTPICHCWHFQVFFKRATLPSEVWVRVPPSSFFHIWPPGCSFLNLKHHGIDHGYILLLSSAYSR